MPDKQKVTPDEALRDSAALAEAQAWWRTNVDDHGEALAAIRTLKSAQAKATQAHQKRPSSFASFSAFLREFWWVPAGMTALFVLFLNIDLSTRFHSTDFASLSELQLGSASVTKSPVITRPPALDGSAPESWLGSNPKLKFAANGKVTLQTLTGAVDGSCSQLDSLSSVEKHADLKFDDIFIESTRYALTASMVVMVQGQDADHQVGNQKEKLNVSGGSLKFTFVGVDGQSVEVDRMVLPPNR